jgi:hypothetical protein
VITWDRAIHNTGPSRKSSPLVKIQGDSYSFEIAEYECDSQSALSSTSVEGKGIKLKNCIYNKKYYISF